MLKLFQKVRRKLVEERSFKRYFLYSLGEIILIVLGILIALQVSTWNNKKENHYQAQRVLSALQVEFTNNKDQLINVRSYHLRVKNASEDLLDQIVNYPDQYSEAIMDSLLADYGYFMPFDPYNSALETAISSGDIHLIENDSLINLLFSWLRPIACIF